MHVNDIRHSMESGSWYTNIKEVSPIREVLGRIDLDPCGSERSNEIIKATTFLSMDGQHENWRSYGTTGFVNPPGCCPFNPFNPADPKKGLYVMCNNKGRCSCGLPKKFLLKCYEEAARGFSSVYLAYNISQLRQLSKIQLSCHTTIAIPPDRFKFLKPETLSPSTGANADSALLMISEDRQIHSRFVEKFTSLGYTAWEPTQ